MRRKLRCTILGLFIALATSGCAEMNHLLTALDADPRLQALGPGAVFPTIDDAAVDALTYTYLRASEENDTEHMRAGTIYSVDTGYSYGEIHAFSNVLEGPGLLFPEAAGRRPFSYVSTPYHQYAEGLAQ
jgi:hypothetical protein